MQSRVSQAHPTKVIARRRALLAASIALALGAAACGSSSDDGGGGSGGSGGSGTQCSDKSVDTSGCDAVLSPGDKDATTLETALIGAKTSSKVCMCPGTYKLDQALTLTTPQVTLRGLGSKIDDVT